MGFFISCACNACGLSSDVRIGGSRASFRTRSTWPIHCRACKDLALTNVQKEPLACETCGSQDIHVFGEKRSDEDWEALMKWLDESGPIAARDSDRYLLDKTYPCPRCGAGTFHFGEIGRLFD